MKHASSRQVFEYWNEQRGDRIAPERGDIEPGPIRRALGDTFILGQDAGGVYRFRLAGTRTCALFCRELKGRDFIGLWAENEQPKMRELVRAAADDCLGFVAGASGQNGARATVGLEMVLLPLRRRYPSRTRLLGVLAPPVPPYWLGSTPLKGLTCGTVRYLGAHSGLIAAPRLVPGAEDARMRKGLTIYDGGRS